MAIELSSNLEAALDFHRRGMYPIPLCWPGSGGRCGCGRHDKPHDVGKAPLLGKGYQNLLPSEDDIRAWWGQYPEANVGILLEPSNLVYVGPDNGTSYLWVVNQGMPETIVRASRNAGFLCRRPEGWPTNTTKYKQGGIEVDLKANGYCVAHGRHQNGRRIYLQGDQVALAPDWVRPMLEEKSCRSIDTTSDVSGPPVRLDDRAMRLWSGELVVDKADGRVKPAAEADEVDRSATLYAIAGELYRAGATSSTISAALADRDIVLGFDKYASRSDGGAGDYGSIAYKVENASIESDEAQPIGHQPVKNRGEPVRASRTGDLNAGHSPYPVHWAVDALGPIPPARWQVQGLMTRGSVNLVFGPHGEGKTYLMLDLGLNVSVGRPWMGRPTEGGPVLLIDEESGHHRIMSRLRAMMDGLDLVGAEPPIACTTIQGVDLTNPNSVARVQATVDAMPQKPVLMVIDALVDVMGGGDENSAGDTQRVFMALRRLAEKNDLTIVVIHHANKSGDIRGSTAIPAAIDLGLEVKALPSADPSVRPIRIKSVKTRDIPPIEIAAEIRFAEWGRIEVTEKACPTRVARSKQFTDLEKHVIRYLQGCPGRRALAEDIKANPGQFSPRTVEDAVARLRQAGVLRRSNEGGKGTKAEIELAIDADELTARGL